MYRKVILVALIIAVQTTAALLGGAGMLARQTEKAILPGVQVEGVPLGGMEEKTALAHLKQRLGSSEKKKLVLLAGDSQWEIPYPEIGVVLKYRQAVRKALSVGKSRCPVLRGLTALRLHCKAINIPINVEFNRKKLLDRLARINQEFKQEPVNAALTCDDEPAVIPEREGRCININATLEKIERQKAGLFGPVTAEVEVIEPEITAVDLAEIDGVLGECETKLESSSPNRIWNIKLAAQKINRTILKPGEIFSFNETVGERNRKKGYREAPVLINQLVAYDVGGGICQVATTLYDAALLANLDILERHHHSRPVGYVTPGLDATVAYGFKDLKFKNPHSSPVYICCFVKDHRLVIKILGKADPGSGRVKLLVEVDKIPPNEVIKKTSSIASGKRVIKRSGQPGYKATVYRIISDKSGEEKRELISRDYYPPQQRIILEGMPAGKGEKN